MHRVLTFRARIQPRLNERKHPHYCLGSLTFNVASRSRRAPAWVRSLLFTLIKCQIQFPCTSNRRRLWDRRHRHAALTPDEY